jgi:hypothetical protein
VQFLSAQQIGHASFTAVGKCATALEYAQSLSSMPSSNVRPLSAAAADANSDIRLATCQDKHKLVVPRKKDPCACLCLLNKNNQKHD